MDRAQEKCVNIMVGKYIYIQTLIYIIYFNITNVLEKNKGNYGAEKNKDNFNFSGLSVCIRDISDFLWRAVARRCVAECKLPLLSMNIDVYRGRIRSFGG